MKLSMVPMVILISLFTAVSRSDDNATHKGDEQHYIKAELRGILERAPGGNVAWYPVLRVNNIHWQLGSLPVTRVDEAGKREPSWYRLVGKTVLVTGTLQIRPDVLQKTGKRRTEYHVKVKTLKVAEEEKKREKTS